MRARTVATTLREAKDIVAHGLAPADDLAVLEEVASRYAVAVTADLAALIDASDPQDPIARQFIPSAAELDSAPGERADPIGDDAYSPVPGIVHRYPDRVLFKLGQADCAVGACLRSGARLYPPPSGDLGSHSHRRRPVDAFAAAARRDHE
jgi:lysine 2,3-aminomutase